MQRVIRALGFFLSGLGISLIIGYWLKQEELNKQASTPTARRQAKEENHVVLSQKTLDAAEAKTSQAADDLTRIHGIGVKTAQALQQMGIHNFVALAAASPQEVYEKLSHMRGMSVEKVQAWIAEAKDYTA